jgi:hypothetical protein
MGPPSTACPIELQEDKIRDRVGSSHKSISMIISGYPYVCTCSLAPCTVVPLLQCVRDEPATGTLFCVVRLDRQAGRLGGVAASASSIDTTMIHTHNDSGRSFHALTSG